LVPPGGSATVDTTGTPLVQISFTLSEPLPAQHDTATSVSCSRSTVVAARSTTCTATVTDTAASDQTPPTGAVDFTSDSPGSFGSRGQCTLAAAGASSASCSVTYTPASTTANRVRTDTISADYRGDFTHNESQGQTQISVISPRRLPKARS
jgi:hypothetical protein